MSACVFILVILETLLLENLDSHASVAREKLLLLSSDGERTFNTLLVPVNLDRVFDHEILRLLPEADALGLIRIATVCAVAALAAAILNIQTFFLGFLEGSEDEVILII